LDINLSANVLRLSDDEISPFLDFILHLIRETGPQGRLRNLQTLDCSEVLLDDPAKKKIQEIKGLAQERGIKVLLQSYITDVNGRIIHT
jgi:hypothetical protein